MIEIIKFLCVVIFRTPHTWHLPTPHTQKLPCTTSPLYTTAQIYTVTLDCYDTPKMLILVFIEFRENQEW